jgi:hypothetical protein
MMAGRKQQSLSVGDQIQLHLGDDVSTYRDRQAGISWPLPVDAKLEELLKAVRAVGERTSRREIVAAIVAMSNFTGKELSDLLHEYRLAKVGQVLRPSEASNVVNFTQQASGPRRRGA